MIKIIKCVECGEIKQHLAKNMCSKCYTKKYRSNNKNYFKQKQTEWKINHPHYARDWAHRTGRAKPMAQNKSCVIYLGVYIAEQILSKVFKDVKVMPYGNPGYDFKCNNGYLIDVKSSCLINKGEYKSWNFTIRKNKIPDYFLLLAFDNREDLNPLHLWLIPSNIINDKHGISISKSTIPKWDKHKLNINKVILCCNQMRVTE